MRVTGLQPYLGDVGQPLHNGCHSLHVARDGHVSDAVVMHDLYPSQLGVGGVHLSTQHLGGGGGGGWKETDVGGKEGESYLLQITAVYTHIYHITSLPPPSPPC